MQKGRRAPHWRRTFFRLLFSSRDPALRWLFIAGFLFVAVVQTGSRGGFAGAVVSLVTFAAIWLIKFRHLRSLSLPAFLVTATISVSSPSRSSRTQGFLVVTTPGSSTETRLSLYREAMNAIGDRPFTGHGAGTYAAVQPIYQSSATPPQFVWKRSHSTYLEAAVTLGLPATILFLVISVLILVWITGALARCKQANPALIAAIPVAAMAAVHSLVDFSLQMQAVALYFVTFAGLGIGGAAVTQLSVSSTPREDVRDQLANNGHRQGLVLRVAAFLVGVIAVVAFVANLRIAAVESTVPPSLWLASLRLYVPQPSLPRLTLPDWASDRDWGNSYARYTRSGLSASRGRGS